MSPKSRVDHGGREAKSVVHEYNCCIRTRLKRKANKDLWWTISDDGPLVAEISELIQAEALPLFQRFENRDQILDEFQAAPDSTELMAVPLNRLRHHPLASRATGRSAATFGSADARPHAQSRPSRLHC